MRPSYIPFTRTLSASFLAVFRRFAGGFPAAFLLNATSFLAFLGKLSAYWRLLALSGSFPAVCWRLSVGVPRRSAILTTIK